MPGWWLCRLCPMNHPCRACKLHWAGSRLGASTYGLSSDRYVTCSAKRDKIRWKALGGAARQEWWKKSTLGSFPEDKATPACIMLALFCICASVPPMDGRS